MKEVFNPDLDAEMFPAAGMRAVQNDEFKPITDEFDAAEIKCVRAQDNLLNAKNPITKFFARMRLNNTQAKLQTIEETADEYEARNPVAR